MQGDKERRVRCISHTPQGEATAGNAAGDTLMVDKGVLRGKKQFSKESLQNNLIKIVSKIP